MRKAVIIATVFMAIISFPACQKQEGRDTDNAGGTVVEPDLTIALTEELVTRYVKTLPLFAKIAGAGGEAYDTVSAALLAKSEVVKLLKDDGWRDSRQFVDVHGKITGVRSWIAASEAMQGQSEESLEVFAVQFRKEFRESKVTDEERKILWANQPKLLAAIRAAAE